ncbi:MAG: ATP-binding protein, partial [Bacteroidota bacterium]
EFFEEDLSGAFISSVDGKLLACNQQYAHIFGYDLIEEALATPASQYYVKSGDREKFLALVKENKKLENYEENARKKDGRPIHLVENIIGKFDEQGELVEIRGYVMDITHRRLLEEHLRQAQKMESVGTLAGGIAHDFNNILGIIMGYTSIIERVPGLPAGVGQSLETINKAVHRGAGVVRQLLTFARKGDVNVESIDVNHVVEELTGMLSETFPRSINLSTQLTDHKLRILADHTQLVQAMLNLCVNARDAMPNGGTLAIVTDVRSGNLLKPTNREAVSGPYAYVAVTDTGHGMSEEVRKRVFEPFFTTKATGKGTGLGMAVVYGIVNAYNGFIEIESVE